MTDPFRIEQTFQDLLATLASPASSPWRLTALAQFLEALDVEVWSSEPYLLELAQHLPALIHALDPVGLDPEAVAALVRRLEHARDSLPVLKEVEDFDAALGQLRRAAATLYAYAGDVQAAFAMVAGRAVDEDPAWLVSITRTEDVAPLERLQWVLTQAQAHNHPAAEPLTRIVDGWKAMLDPVRDSTVVPVVERPLMGEDGRLLGGLRRLRIELFSARAEADDLRRDVSVFGAEGDQDAVLSVPVRAARRLLATTYPPVSERYVTGLVRFGKSYAWHEGRSSDLAVAALFYGAVLQFTEQRGQYHVAPGAAFSGQIDETGHVLPVDAATLAVKVRTAFFSWVDCLAVPQAQVAQAQEVCSALEAAYPHRQLELVGITRLREVFYDRRLSTYGQAGLVRHVARKAWRRRFRVGALALILVLTLAVARMAYGPLDKNPVAGEVVGEFLHLKNADNQTVSKIWIGSKAARRYAAYPIGFHQRLYAFTDVNGDGINEVIWVEWEQNELDQVRALRCTSASGDVTYWSTPLHFPLDFPRRPDITEHSYLVQGLSAGDGDGDGETELIALIHHRHYFPSIVARYKAATGDLEAYYLHTGRLQTMASVDLDDDGIVEIVAGGTNNAFDGEAVLVVLDPRYLSGRSPTQGIYVPSGYAPGRERTYLRIPRTEIGETQRALNPYVEIRQFNQMPGQLIARYSEVRVEGVPVYLLLHFDHHLVPLTVGLDSRYRLLGERLYAEGRTATVPDTAYLDAYMKLFQYWDGDAWQHEPVMNQRYLEEVTAQ